MKPNIYQIKSDFQKTKEFILKLNDAISQLETAIKTTNPNQLEIDGTLHRFEFCLELFCKTLKSILSDIHGIDINGPKLVLQQAYTSHIINDEITWINMLKDRNLTSHIYNQKVAEEIYKKVKTYVPFLRQEFEQCKNKH